MSSDLLVHAGIIHGGEGNIMIPDARDGFLQIKVNDPEFQGLIHVSWMPCAQTQVEIDLYLLPSEGFFVCIDVYQRIIALCFSSSKQRQFFWLQESDQQGDTLLIERMNAILSFHSPAIPNSPEGMINLQHHNAIPNSSEGVINLQHLQNALSSVQEKDIELKSLLKFDNVKWILDNQEVVESLYIYLPQEHRTLYALEKLLLSPQFQQTCDIFQYAISTGTCSDMLRGFGLQPGACGVHSVNMLLKVLIKYSKQNKNDASVMNG